MIHFGMIVEMMYLQEQSPRLADTTALLLQKPHPFRPLL